MWSFPTTSYGKVTDGNDGYGKTAAFQYALIKKPVTYAYHASVKPTKGYQPFFYLDEITFHKPCCLFLLSMILTIY